MKITFTNTIDFADLEKPKPASQLIPEWYKEMSSYIDDKKIPQLDGNTNATIKRCIPVFDAITAGYIIELPGDVYVRIVDGQQYFSWTNFDLVKFHSTDQAPNHPERKPYSYPKWINPWAIKTPNGYSTMFIQPMHRESVFTILPGIVDTDTYTASVNFPFVINDPNFEGLIPKGTPIAQVIPFKRESWKMEFGSEKELYDDKQVVIKLSTKFFDKYKTMFWHRKEYK
jgi:hypothetical protein